MGIQITIEANVSDLAVAVKVLEKELSLLRRYVAADEHKEDRELMELGMGVDNGVKPAVFKARTNEYALSRVIGAFS